MTTFSEEFAKFQNPTDMVIELLRNTLSALLGELQEKQRDFFHRLYPEGVDALPEWQLKNAIDQCQRTIAKNRAAQAA